MSYKIRVVLIRLIISLSSAIILIAPLHALLPEESANIGIFNEIVNFLYFVISGIFFVSMPKWYIKKYYGAKVLGARKANIKSLVTGLFVILFSLGISVMHFSITGASGTFSKEELLFVDVFFFELFILIPIIMTCTEQYYWRKYVEYIPPGVSLPPEERKKK